jgi:hypothetical protein
MEVALELMAGGTTRSIGDSDIGGAMHLAAKGLPPSVNQSYSRKLAEARYRVLITFTSEQTRESYAPR